VLYASRTCNAFKSKEKEGQKIKIAVGVQGLWLVALSSYWSMFIVF